MTRIDEINPGRAMDALLATTIMADRMAKWHADHACKTSGCFRCVMHAPRWSTDMADAWQVVAKINAEHPLERFRLLAVMPSLVELNSTEAAAAICRVALRIWEEKEGIPCPAA